MDLDRILTDAVNVKASDIHLKVASKPKMRVNTILKDIPGYDVVTQVYMVEYVNKILGKSESKR
jgi:twitching motility protein PilT